MELQGRQALKLELMNTRARLMAEIADLRDFAVKATTYLEDETDAYDQHIADGASSMVERQKDMTLLTNLQRELADTDNALSRMEQGTYGSCEICRKPISERRLTARPMATTCIECQSEIEARQRREAGAPT